MQASQIAPVTQTREHASVGVSSVNAGPFAINRSAELRFLSSLVRVIRNAPPRGRDIRPAVEQGSASTAAARGGLRPDADIASVRSHDSQLRRRAASPDDEVLIHLQMY